MANPSPISRSAVQALDLPSLVMTRFMQVIQQRRASDAEGLFSPGRRP